MKNALMTKGAGVNTIKSNFNTYAPNYSATDQFREAMQSAGISYSGKVLIPDIPGDWNDALSRRESECLI